MLREKLIRLAHEKPELRAHLVPLIRLADEADADAMSAPGYSSPAPTDKKKGPPARWDEFLKEKYEGGKKRIPNPNPKTRDKFKDIAYSTALKDKAFMAKAMKEYSAWAKKTKEPGKSKGKAKAETKTPAKPNKSQADENYNAWARQKMQEHGRREVDHKQNYRLHEAAQKKG